MMKYLVLGGCGFIGTSLTKKLAKKQENVITVADWVCQSHAKGNIRYFKTLFDEGTNFLELTREQDIVIHGISTTSPRNFRGMRAEISENLLPTIQLLEACISNGVKKVLFLSSGGTVYGESPDRVPFTEDAPCKPICAYGMQKYAIEMLLEVYKRQYGLNYVTARIGNPYGPRQFTNGVGVISTFTRLLTQGNKIVLLGGGKTVRDYIYIEDLTEALTQLIEYNGKFSTFNVSNGIGYTVNDILDILSDLLNIKPQIEYLPNTLSDVAYNVLNISHIQRETGFCPHTSLQQGIETLLKYYIKE